MELDWENLLDEWDGENYWESLAWENCSRPKRNLGDFSNRGLYVCEYGLCGSRE